MKKLATCAVAITGFIGTSAFAADMGVPAAPPPAPVWSWTGWYAGVNVGASMGTVKTDFRSAPLFGIAGQTPFTPGFFNSDTESPDGFIGGGQIGYNWQYSPLIVVGLEADFQGALERNTVLHVGEDFNFTDPADTSLNPTHCGVFTGVSTSPCTNSIDYTTQIDWFGTVRARIGYVWGNGQVLTYATGGLAYGEVKINGTNTVFGTVHIDQLHSFGPGPFAVSQAFDHSQVNTGWVVGYGTEGRLGNTNWTWKVENLYMDLGHLDSTSVTSASSLPLSGNGAIAGGQVTTNSHFTDWILRGGLNYKFY